MTEVFPFWLICSSLIAYVIYLICGSVRSGGLAIVISTGVVMYAAPCLWGSIPNLVALGGQTTIVPDVYIAWSILISLTIISFLLLRKPPACANANVPQYPFSSYDGPIECMPPNYASWIALTLIYWTPFVLISIEMGFSQTFLAIGKSGHSYGDATAIAIAQAFMRVACGLMLIMAMLNGGKAILAYSLLHQAFQMASGDRTGIVMSIAAYVILMPLISRGSRKSTSLIALASAVMVIGVLGKHLYIDVASLVMGEKPTATIDYLHGDGSARFDFPYSLEPFGIMSVTNRIVETNYAVNTHYLWGWWAQLFPVSGPFGYPSSAFYNEYQPDLFPAVRHGLAYSWIGEGYAVGGLFGVFVWAVIWAVGLFIHLHIISKTKSTIVLSALTLSLAYWSFYVHRNSLFSLFAFTKQIFYLGSAVYIITLVYSQFVQKKNMH